MRLYIHKSEVMNDEYVQLLVKKLEIHKGEKTVDELVKRIVEIANAHIWGLVIGLIQEQENEEV